MELSVLQAAVLGTLTGSAALIKFTVLPLTMTAPPVLEQNVTTLPKLQRRSRECSFKEKTIRDLNKSIKTEFFFLFVVSLQFQFQNVKLIFKIDGLRRLIIMEFASLTTPPIMEFSIIF